MYYYPIVNIFLIIIIIFFLLLYLSNIIIRKVNVRVLEERVGAAECEWWQV